MALSKCPSLHEAANQNQEEIGPNEQIQKEGNVHVIFAHSAAKQSAAVPLQISTSFHH